MSSLGINRSKTLKNYSISFWLIKRCELSTTRQEQKMVEFDLVKVDNVKELIDFMMRAYQWLTSW